MHSQSVARYHHQEAPPADTGGLRPWSRLRRFWTSITSSRVGANGTPPLIAFAKRRAVPDITLSRPWDRPRVFEYCLRRVSPSTVKPSLTIEKLSNESSSFVFRISSMPCSQNTFIRCPVPTDTALLSVATHGMPPCNVPDRSSVSSDSTLLRLPSESSRVPTRVAARTSTSSTAPNIHDR